MSEVLHECEVCGAPVADERRDEHNRLCHPTEATLEDDVTAASVAWTTGRGPYSKDAVQLAFRKGAEWQRDRDQAEIERLRRFIRDTAEVCEREDQCKEEHCEDGCCETFRGMAISARAFLGESK